jgi:DNA topoisomerase-1
MSDAELQKTQIKINISNRAENFIANGEVLVFPGFLSVYVFGIHALRLRAFL